MGKIGRCCCDPEQCLCDSAWAFTSWSFSVFGKSYSGSWIPSVLVTEDCSRSGQVCIYDDPLLVVDTLEDGGWVDLGIPGLSSLCQCGSCSPYSGQKVSSWRRSSAYSSRVAVWHHIQSYASITVTTCEDNSVRFVVTVIYSVTRIVQAIDRTSNRFKKWERDCDAGTQEAVGDFVYLCGGESDYIITEIVLPCSWPQLDTAGLCLQATNETTPTCEAAGPTFVNRDVVSLQCIDTVCTPVTTATEFACAAGSVDGGCGCSQPFQTCFFGVPVDALTGARAQRRQYEVTWESECYNCDSIPSTVTLERTDSVPTIALTGDVTVNIFDSATGTGCGTAPAVPITIPFTLSVSVS